MRARVNHRERALRRARRAAGEPKAAERRAGGRGWYAAAPPYSSASRHGSALPVSPPDEPAAPAGRGCKASPRPPRHAVPQTPAAQARLRCSRRPPTQAPRSRCPRDAMTPTAADGCMPGPGYAPRRDAPAGPRVKEPSEKDEQGSSPAEKHFFTGSPSGPRPDTLMLDTGRSTASPTLSQRATKEHDRWLSLSLLALDCVEEKIYFACRGACSGYSLGTVRLGPGSLDLCGILAAARGTAVVAIFSITALVLACSWPVRGSQRSSAACCAGCRLRVTLSSPHADLGASPHQSTSQ